MRYAASAAERGDARAFYEIIDERARHAMISVVADRHRARALIEQSYPTGEREAALHALGDAADVPDAAALFGSRCDDACLRRLVASFGSIESVRRDGDEEIVTTSKGTELRVYRRGGGWYGLVWNTGAWVRERAQANRDLTVIRENAEVYDRRRALERSLRPVGSHSAL
jgi:hypothetical protein